MKGSLGECASRFSKFLCGSVFSYCLTLLLMINLDTAAIHFHTVVAFPAPVTDFANTFPAIACGDSRASHPDLSSAKTSSPDVPTSQLPT